MRKYLTKEVHCVFKIGQTSVLRYAKIEGKQYMHIYISNNIK